MPPALFGLMKRHHREQKVAGCELEGLAHHRFLKLWLLILCNVYSLSTHLSLKFCSMFLFLFFLVVPPAGTLKVQSYDKLFPLLQSRFCRGLM